MKKAIYAFIAVFVILTGCNRGNMPEPLKAVSDIINQHPDSALALLDSMEAEKAQIGRAHV